VVGRAGPKRACFFGAALREGTDAWKNRIERPKRLGRRFTFASFSGAQGEQESRDEQEEGSQECRQMRFCVIKSLQDKPVKNEENIEHDSAEDDNHPSFPFPAKANAVHEAAYDHQADEDNRGQLFEILLDGEQGITPCP
jgi:hypothetical protein